MIDDPKTEEVVESTETPVESTEAPTEAPTADVEGADTAKEDGAEPE